MAWLHLFWAWDNVMNFCWTNFHSVVFFHFTLPTQPPQLKTVRMVSSKWFYHKKFCGIIMLAGVIYVCLPVMFRKARNKEEVSTLIEAVTSSFSLILFPCLWHYSGIRKGIHRILSSGAEQQKDRNWHVFMRKIVFDHVFSSYSNDQSNGIREWLVRN